MRRERRRERRRRGRKRRKEQVSRMIHWSNAHNHYDCHHNYYWLVVRQELPTYLRFCKGVGGKCQYKDDVKDVVSCNCSQESAVEKISD